MVEKGSVVKLRPLRDLAGGVACQNENAMKKRGKERGSGSQNSARRWMGGSSGEAMDGEVANAYQTLFAPGENGWIQGRTMMYRTNQSSFGLNKSQ